MHMTLIRSSFLLLDDVPVTPPTSNRKRCHFSQKNDLCSFFFENESRFLAKSQFRKIEKLTSIKKMDRDRPRLEPVTFCVPMGSMVQSLTPSGLEIAQCRLQSRFVVENCRSRTECRTDVSGYLRTDTRTVLGQFLWRKATFGGKNDSRPVLLLVGGVSTTK